MVTAASRTLLFAFVIAFGLSLSPLSAKDLGDYQVGDHAEQDILTPIALTVIDADATEALKQKEAQRVPVVVAFFTNDATQAVSTFRSRFRNTRNRFLGAVENAFGRRVLTAKELATPQFEQVAKTFQQQNKLFPLDPNRAALWATGDPDHSYEESLAATIRQTMARPIRADSQSSVGGAIRIVTLASRDELLTAAIAEQRGSDVPGGNPATLAAVKRDFQEFFPNEERAVARYLATFIKANCNVDMEVTSALRARRTEGLVVSDSYPAGQAIVKQGQVIDQKARTALGQLKEKMAFAQLQQLVVTDQIKTARELQAHRWVLGLSGALFVLLLTVIWRLTRRQQTSLLPVPVNNPHQADPWQHRALAAEQKVQQTQAMVRSGVMSQIAHWLSDKIVQRLISHRTHLLETQQKTAAEMNNLEERLKDIHHRMHDRLLVYEKQIAELEKELKDKGEENRELIRAEIETIKRQMEIEREKSEIEVNLSRERN